MIAFDLDGTLLTTHEAYWPGITDEEANMIRMQQKLKYSPKEKFIVVTARSERVSDITYKQLEKFGLDSLCSNVEFVGYDGNVPEKKIIACLKNGVNLLVEDNYDTISEINTDGRIKAVHISEFISEKE